MQSCKKKRYIIIISAPNITKEAERHFFENTFTQIIPIIITVSKIISAEVNLLNEKNVGYQTPHKTTKDANNKFALSFQKIPGLLKRFICSAAANEINIHSKTIINMKQTRAGANKGRRRQLYKYDLPPII